MSFSPEEIEEFKAEAFELLDTAEKGLLSSDFRSSFDDIFRCFHNLKGAAGMMELEEVQSHTHELETIFMTFKHKDILPNEYQELFLRGIDATRSLLEGDKVDFNYNVNEKKDESAELVHELPDSAIDEFITECEEIIERLSVTLQKIHENSFSKEDINHFYRDVHTLKGSSYLFSFGILGDIGHAMESSLEKVRNGTHLPSKLLINGLFKSLEVIDGIIQKLKQKQNIEVYAPVVPVLVKALTQASEKLEGPQVKVIQVVNNKELEKEKEKDHEGLSSIRVSVALLDNLLALMGEMVLVRNQVLQFSRHSEDPEFQSMSKRLNSVTSEIQGEMMRTRMQPIGNVLGRFNRVVRDLAGELEKNIHLMVYGADTELDKSLLEAIKDPLTHIVRNSCDHGIELPHDRLATGKSEMGTIIIRAYHEGGQVVIEVSDDGKGLNKEQILNKAIEKNIIAPNERESLSDKEIFNLLFSPGFSTAAKITNVSGRGVGMDVVRTNIEKVGGTVELTGETGVGTCIKIKIPLTLAIIPALLIRSEENNFAIPQVKLEELLRVDQRSSDIKIEFLHGPPVYRLRGQILPLVDLNQVLGLESVHRDYQHGVFNIVVLSGEYSSFGVIVDEILDTADIVVNPLNRLLKPLKVYSGATVLGDGTIALIFDVLGLSKMANIGQEKKKHVNHDDQAKVSEARDYILIKVNSSTKHAIALNLVKRLEKFSVRSIEYSGPFPVIRYGQTVLPLFNVNQVLNYSESEKVNEVLSVVVIEDSGELFGLMVDGIIDTLSTAIELKPLIKKQSGICGQLNTQHELIVVIDPLEIIETHLQRRVA